MVGAERQVDFIGVDLGSGCTADKFKGIEWTPRRFPGRGFGGV